MIIKDIDLKKKINEFNHDIKTREVVDKAWERHAEFIRLFPFREHPELIENLTPEKVYNPHGDKDYFFNWIEHRFKDLGALSIGSAKVWENARDNIEILKELLRVVIDDSLPISEKIDSHWKDIKGFGGDRHIAKKILFCYYPEKIIPVFKTEDWEDFAKMFSSDYLQQSLKKYGKGYGELSVGQKFELLNDLALEFKHGQDGLNGLDNGLFMRFLYKHYPPSRITEKNSSR